MRRTICLLLLCGLVSTAHAEPFTLPLEKRPAWVERDGIVMAGSWEPLIFRVRRDGGDGYTPTPQQRADYEREHSPEMIDQLKALGVSFVMMHCYKGGGLTAERESMADAVRFAKLCREAGLRVGVYNYSGAFIWELFFKEKPEAKDWVVLDGAGKPMTYGQATYRYFWNRNHPDAQEFYRGLVRFAINDIGVDLIHFDNYHAGPGRDANSVQRFRQYLRQKFTPAQLEQMGVPDVNAVEPPMSGPPDNLLRRAWIDFSCQSLADSYLEMTGYARTLRPDILMECNPGGVGDGIHPPVDHGRLLAGGEAFWDEGQEPGYRDGQLHSRIRTYKVARRMDNIAFAYATTPLEMAESMAFNRDCLGCICWFEYGSIVARPGSKDPFSPALAPYTEFFHQRRDLFRDAKVVADVAVLRSFPSQVFADPRHAQLTARVEQTLIENRAAFQIIYDSHLNDLKRYRALVLAGCVALSDQQIALIKSYVASGGGLCVIGPVATHDEWMMPQAKPGLDAISSEKVIRVDSVADGLDAIKRTCGGEPSLVLSGAAPGVCAEMTEQADRRLVHLVNYRSDGPADNLLVLVRPPPGATCKRVALARPGQGAADLELPFQALADGIKFTVPRVDVYAVAVVGFQNQRQAVQP